MPRRTLTPEEAATITDEDRKKYPISSDAQILRYKNRAAQAKAKNPHRYRSAEAQKKGHARGQVDPVPVSPETRVRKNTPICGAKRQGTSTSGEGICCMPAGWGTDHLGRGACKLHGGCVPSHNNKAIREEAIENAIMYGGPVDIDPDTAVLQELHRTAGHVYWLADQVKAIQDGMLFQETPFGIKPSVILGQYQEERRHLVKVAETAKRMGIQERQIQLAEDQGRMIALILQNFMRDPELGLSPEQMILGRDLIRKHILAIETQQSLVVNSVSSLSS